MLLAKLFESKRILAWILRAMLVVVLGVASDRSFRAGWLVLVALFVARLEPCAVRLRVCFRKKREGLFLAVGFEIYVGL